MKTPKILFHKRVSIEEQKYEETTKISSGVVRMKFLISQCILAQTPIQKLSKLTPARAAQFEYLEELESKGKIEKYYHLMGEQGHRIIVDAASDDELSKIGGEDPLFFHSKREIHPLAMREIHKTLKRTLGQGNLTHQHCFPKKLN